LVQVGHVDATDGDHGAYSGLDSCHQLCGPSLRQSVWLGLGDEDGAEPNVVSAFGRAYLCKIVSAPANHSVGSQDFPCLRDSGILLSKVYSVSANGQGNVRVVIDDEARLQCT